MSLLKVSNYQQMQPILAQPINGNGDNKLDEEYELEALNLLHQSLSDLSDSDLQDDDLFSEQTPKVKRKEDSITRLVKAPRFSLLVGVVIFINTVVMALETDNKDWQIWPYVDTALLLFFVIEMCMRLYTYRGSFFTSPAEKYWNIFDFVVVVFGVLDLWILQPMRRLSGGVDNKGSHVSRLVTVLRIVRILRILRLLRLFKMFHELYLLATGLVQSVKVVGWISFLFSIVVVVSAIFCTTIIGHEKDSFPEPVFIDEYFGSVARSMTTLFQFITLDDWSYVAGKVTCHIPAFHVFFIIYIILTSFMVLSLLTGVVTDNIVKLTDSDEDKVEDAHEESKVEFESLIEELLQTFHSKQGAIHKAIMKPDFDKLIQDDEVRLKLLHHDIEIDNIDRKDLFESMDIENLQELSEPVFMEGFNRMRGPATAKDVVKLGAAVQKVDKQLSSETVSPLEAFQVKTQKLCSRCDDSSERIGELADKMHDFLDHMGYTPRRSIDTPRTSNTDTPRRSIDTPTPREK